MGTGTNEPFKICGMCNHIWETRLDFLTDPAIELRGYMADFEELELGILVFQHESCTTSVSVKAERFTDLYEGEIFQKRLTGSQVCPEYCLHFDELRACGNECECAYVRDILRIVKEWPKS